MKHLQRLYEWLFAWTKGFQSILLLIIRLIWGWGFLKAGFVKLNDLSTVTHYFSSLHIPEPGFMALVVAVVEFVGGAFLILGLLSRLSAFFLSCAMIGTYVFAYYPDALKSVEAFTKTDSFLYLYASLIVLAFGAGAFSIDALIQRGEKK